MIERIVMEQSSGCVMAGTGGGPGGGGAYQQQQQYNQGYQQQQAGGQQDYSAEWAAYYAAQAVAQAQQTPAAAAPAPTPAPAAAAAAPGPASDAYYEDFFRYAYYYGEPAARQYYGAWSPPEGTPNPYGVNPDGVTAPPASAGQAAAPAPAPQSAPAPAPVQQQISNARDTGVRKVSNLPAWMTRQQP